MEGEPAAWFDLFDAYRLMGPSRTVQGAIKARGGKHKRTSGAAHRASQDWNWQGRAEAWDAHERTRRYAEMERDRLALRERLRAFAEKGLTEAERRLDFLASQDLGEADPATTEAGVVRLAEWAERVALDSVSVPLLERLKDRLEALLKGTPDAKTQ
jgi:hypothetical protein